MIEVGNYKVLSTSKVVGDNGVTYDDFSLDLIRLTKDGESLWFVKEIGFGPGPRDAGHIIYIDTAVLNDGPVKHTRPLTKDERAFWKANIEAIYRADNSWCRIQTSDPCLTEKSLVPTNSNPHN